MIWVDSRTRAASPREGGKIINTDIEPANVRVDGDGPPILLLHGFGAAIDWWDDVAPALAIHHRVIRLDLIGHGGTAAPTRGYSIPRQAQLAAAVLDTLDIGHVTVIGHSHGRRSRDCACRASASTDRSHDPDRQPAHGGHGFYDNDQNLSHANHRPHREMLSHFQSDAAIRRGLSQGFAPNFTIPERFVADFRQLTYCAFRKAHNESIAYRTNRPPYDRLAAMKPSPPLLVIFGTLDAIVPPEQANFFERVPGVKIAMIEGAGHSPMVEAPAKTLKLIEDFLK